MDFKAYNKIVILTGAGISADSGLATFRDSNGLWENHRIEDVATPEAFAKDPLLVWRFYSMRRLNASQAHPNEAHKSLVQFADSHPELKVSLITQNVDGLHHRADSRGVLTPICMHGSLHQSSCVNCGAVYFDDYAYFDLDGNYAPQETNLCDSDQKASQIYLHHFRLEYESFLPLSPCCRKLIRPYIVWFGEIPLHMEEIQDVLSEADLFVSIGTSGQVYPAAGFLQLAKSMGAKTVSLNKEMTSQGPFVDEFIQGNAKDIVPKFFL